MKKVLQFVALIILGTSVPAWVYAEATPGKGRERARTFLVLRLSEALNLSEEKALKVSQLLRDSELRRKDLAHQRAQLEQKVRAALEKPPVDAAALSKFAADANEIDEQLALTPGRTMREVQGLLTPEQQARLILFRPELQKQVNRAIRHRMKSNRRPRTRDNARREPTKPAAARSGLTP